MCDEWRSRRQQVIWRRGGKEQKADVFAWQSGLRNCHLACANGEIRKGLIVSRVAPRIDAGAPLDPTGIEPESDFDLGIRNDAIRRIMAKPDDFNATHALPSSAASEIAA
jgi:hypothetical protein